ncbi:MAG: N-acetylmuramoyl-L-alanine amidase [bacterium]|nr:N-acetylmuramoyl-L-alanine amidase [bacterium]
MKGINNLKYKVFIFILLFSSLVLAQENQYQIIFSESGKREEILSEKIDGKEYILIDNLQKIFFLGKNLQLTSKKIDLSYKDKKVSFFINSNEVRIGSQIRQLSLPVREAQKKYFLPLEVINKILPELLTKEINYKKSDKTFIVSDKKAGLRSKDVFTTIEPKTTIDRKNDNKKKSLVLPSNKPAIYTVVLDPGHGGIDPGAIGPTGLKEKNVVLEIALKAKKLLTNNLGINVVLTRERDEFIPLRKRAAIANNAKADLFISIHVNASRRQYANGIEVYFLSAAMDDDSRAVAAFENEVVKYEKKDKKASDIEFTLWDIVQTEHIQTSRVLASILGEQLKKNLSMRNRGVKAAPFLVLEGANTPSILVEMGFITNKQEESNMKKESVLAGYAQQVFNGVLAFKSKYDAQGGKK